PLARVIEAPAVARHRAPCNLAPALSDPVIHERIEHVGETPIAARGEPVEKQTATERIVGELDRADRVSACAATREVQEIARGAKRMVRRSVRATVAGADAEDDRAGENTVGNHAGERLGPPKSVP